MFPVLRLAVQGLDPETLYDLKLDFLPSDHYRWRYVSGQWQTNGKQDNLSNHQDRRYGLTSKGEPYSHPKSPNYGRFWMSDIVEFKNVKLTNRLNPAKDDHVNVVIERSSSVLKSILFFRLTRLFSIHCININLVYIFYNRYRMDNRIFF
jgi:T-box